MSNTKNIDDWAAERIGEYPRESLLNLPIACHGCEYAYLLAEDLISPEYCPEVETEVLDLGLCCPILPAEILKRYSYCCRSRTMPIVPYRYRKTSRQLRLFDYLSDGDSQLQLFEADPWGPWSDWEGILLPYWYCASDEANGYLSDLLICADETEDGTLAGDSYYDQYEEFLASIKQPNGCMYFESFRK